MDNLYLQLTSWAYQDIWSTIGIVFGIAILLSGILTWLDNTYKSR